MKHDADFGAANAVPQWSTPAEARRELEREIDRVVRGAATGRVTPEAALALRVTAGLGKTATTLRVIARHAAALLARGHVLVHVPTLDLAERACKDFQALAPKVPARVIRGRDAPRPLDPRKPMCERAGIARSIAGFVPSITEALCRAQDPVGNLVRSPCASGCSYLAQKDVAGPHVVFLSHAYLTVDPPVDRDFDIALRVIDEKVWPTLATTSQISIEDLMRAPAATFPADLHDILGRAKAALVDGLQRGFPLHDHMRGAGISSEQLLRLANAEERSRVNLKITPSQPPAAITFRINTFDARSHIASRRRQQIFTKLAGREAGHCASLKAFEIKTGTGTRCMIESCGLHAIARDAPLLLLDADADPDITDRMAPGARFVAIQSPPVADIVQVSDLTLSNNWLLHPDEGSTRRASVLAILEREVRRAAGGGVLVVATKRVLAALHGDLGRPAAEEDDEALRQPLLGAQARWFGPRTQGVNDYETFAAIVIIGRLQPGVNDVETTARAVFSGDALPIEAHISGALPATDAQVLLADGSMHQTLMRAHPDPRVQAILAQSRECATLQAIARLRLVVPNCAKRVVILSSQPLPEFPVTRLATLAALERDLEHEPDWHGFARMERALRATPGRPVGGARLSAAGLAADLPRDFETLDSARRFRRGRSTAQLSALCGRIAAANGWKMTALSLRRPTGGKAVPAIVLDDRDGVLALARSLWPDCVPELG